MHCPVSFIIPCFNEANYIASCLASIDRQVSLPAGYEVIVVDNGSTDATREVAASLGSKIIDNPTQGAAASRNLGAQHAQGDFLAYVDADCILDARWLSSLMEISVGAGVAAAAARALPDQARMTWVEKAWCSLFVSQSGPQKKFVTSVSNLGSSNLLLRRDTFLKSGGFDEALLTCEDYDLSQRLIGFGKLLIDERTHVLHLRESKTLSELFNREVGRGRYSLRCLIKNQFSLREIPSVAVPLLNLGATIAILPALVSQHNGVSLSLLVFLMVMPVLYIAKRGFIWNGLAVVAQEYIIAATYLMARSLALVKELGDLARVFASLRT